MAVFLRPLRQSGPTAMPTPRRFNKDTGFGSLSARSSSHGGDSPRPRSGSLSARGSASPRSKTSNTPRSRVSSEELADRAQRAIEAHLSRYAKRNGTSWSNSSLSNSSAAFSSRSELFDRTGSYLRDMGDPGGQNDPHAHTTIGYAAAKQSLSTFNRSSSSGSLCFGSRLERPQMAAPRMIEDNPGPGQYEARQLNVPFTSSLGSSSFTTESPKGGVQCFLKAKEAAATPEPGAYEKADAHARQAERTPGGVAAFKDGMGKGAFKSDSTSILGARHAPQTPGPLAYRPVSRLIGDTMATGIKTPHKPSPEIISDVARDDLFELNTADGRRREDTLPPWLMHKSFAPPGVSAREIVARRHLLRRAANDRSPRSQRQIGTARPGLFDGKVIRSRFLESVPQHQRYVPPAVRV